MQEPTYYEILGVSLVASSSEIKIRYKALALKFHPDKESSSIAKEAMVSINNAYEVLSDPKRRIAYDLGLKRSFTEPRHCGSHAKWSGQYLGKIFNIKRAPVLIASAILITCLAGYQFETSHADAKSLSDGFMKTNHHYFMASVHEAALALPTCIPIVGIAWGIIAGFMSGFIDKAVIIMVPSFQSKVSGLVISYVILATTLKLAAYQIGMYRSFALVILIRRRHFTKLDKIFTQADIILVVLLSSLAGFVEHAMVNAA